MTESRFLPGFRLDWKLVNGVRTHYASAGDGPPVLLLHGHPQTHVIWRKIAPDLVKAGYSVVASDLRGYGDSEKVPSHAPHHPYAKREMAKDQVELMRALGHDRFAVVGHDRGGYSLLSWALFKSVNALINTRDMLLSLHSFLRT